MKLSCCLAVLCAAVFSSTVAFAQTPPHPKIAAFNRNFTDATRHMDNAATMSLWAEDGISLLPGEQAIVGKPTIAKFLEDVTAKISGYKVVSQTNDFHDLEVAGDWASEWANTTQVIQPPGNQPKITIYGKVLLVLRRDKKDGAWKIKEEAFTTSPAPVH